MIGGLGNINVTTSRTGMQIADTGPRFFVARITAVGTAGSGSGSGCGVPHAWVKQRIPKDGCDYEDDPDGPSGTTTLSPAYALGGGSATVDQLVLMWERGVTARDAGTVYDFIGNGVSSPVGSGSGAGTYIDVVTDVCTIAAGSGG